MNLQIQRDEGPLEKKEPCGSEQQIVLTAANLRWSKSRLTAFSVGSVPLTKKTIGRQPGIAGVNRTKHFNLGSGSLYSDQRETLAMKSRVVHDRALLLYGCKRNRVLNLAEVQQYGLDSFADADYVSIYGMPPREWYRRGVRLLGRTAVECTRDALGDHIGRDVASVAIRMPANQFLVIDPFAGSCNTLFWILRSLPNSEAIAFESDQRVFD